MPVPLVSPIFSQFSCNAQKQYIAASSLKYKVSEDDLVTNGQLRVINLTKDLLILCLYSLMGESMECSDEYLHF